MPMLPIGGRIRSSPDRLMSPFQTKGGHDTAALAEDASRLAAGTEAAIDDTPVVDGWNVAYGMTVQLAGE
jgi:hypothetical protein